MSSLSAVGAKIEGVEGSIWGYVPLPRKFLHFFLFQNGEFLCMPAWISIEQPQPENVLLNK